MTAASMPRLVLVTPHFAPESGAAARRCTALAFGLQRRGWQVRVVTQLPHHPAMRIFDGFDVATPDRRVEDGVEVARVRPGLPRGDDLVARLRAEARFALAAVRLGRQIAADVVVASSPYFVLGPAGLRIARRMRVPFVWDVRDLTWLYPRATGKRTFGFDHLVDGWMRATAAAAAMVVTTSRAQRDYFAPRLRASEVIPNGITRSEFEALAPGEKERCREPGAPRLCYVGMFGFMHGLRLLLDVAEQLPDAELHLYGDGPERSALEGEAQLRRLSNVRFHGHVGKAQVIAAYREADVLLAPLRDHAVFRMIQPAKIWEYLATGCPVVHAGSGETAGIMTAEELGWVVEPGSAYAIAAAVRSILADRAVAQKVALRARSWVEEERLREDQVERWHAVLQAVVMPGWVDASAP